MNFYSLVFFISTLLTPGLLSSMSLAQEPLHSFARPDEVAVKHLHLDLYVDFDKQTIAGSAKLTLDRKVNAKPLILDSHGLDISGVTDADGSVLAYGRRRFIAQPADIPRAAMHLVRGGERPDLLAHQHYQQALLQWRQGGQAVALACVAAAL